MSYQKDMSLSGRALQQVVSLLLVFRLPLSVDCADGHAPDSQLTPERILAQSSLNGELLQQPHWNAAGTRLAWLKKFSRPAAVKSNQPPPTEIDCIDVSTSQQGMQRSVLVSVEKIRAALESARPAQHANDKDPNAPEAPGLTGFAWAPGDRALLLMTPVSLMWMDLETGESRVLVSGAEGTEDGQISDAQISPDGRYVSFVRDHALWLISTSAERTAGRGAETYAGGIERASRRRA